MGEETEQEVEEWLGIHRLLVLAEEVTTEYFAGEVWPIPLAAVAYIESGGNPRATRFESHLGTCSVGLCQTLLVTARWLVTDTTAPPPPGVLCHRPVGAPVPKPPEIADPTQLSLMDPFTSMWYGAAYLAHLSTHGHQGRTEEWTVRAYNAGPTGVETKNTDKYWAKYSTAKKVIMDGLCASLCGGCLYQIRQGDTLWSIAQANCVSLTKLEMANDQVKDPGSLAIGQLLVVPGKNAREFIKKESKKFRTPPSRRGSGWRLSDRDNGSTQLSPWWRPVALGSAHWRRVVLSSVLLFGGAAAAGLLAAWQPTARSGEGVGSSPRPAAAAPSASTSEPSAPVSSPPQPSAAPDGPVAVEPPEAKATAAPKGKAYTIQPGDTLSRVARENGCSVSELLQCNPNLAADPNKIAVGSAIEIPL